MPLFVWVIIILGVGSIGGYLLFKYFKSEWKPYIALTKQVINFIKFLIKAFDKDPNTLSVYEIFIDVLERSFKVVEEIINDQEVIAGMTLEGQISYIRAKIETAVNKYFEDNSIELTEDNQNAINTVMNIMDFFLKLLLPKLSPEIKP
jgi:hypothetical protein